MTSSLTKTSQSTKRLLKDLKEIEQNPLDTVYAQPVEKNLHLWYATVNHQPIMVSFYICVWNFLLITLIIHLKSNL